jgi:D-3-phosphoglycerate dehydrogenase
LETFKILLTDYEYSSLAPEMEIVEQLGAELITAQCRTEDEVIEAAMEVDGIINQYAPLSRRVIESLKKCKVISRYGIGVDTVDLEAATEKGIIVGNVTDYCIDEVSDHAFALLITGARKVVQLNQAVKEGNWSYKVGAPIFRLRGRVLGLIGFGKIPQSVAQKAQAFGLRVVAYDPYVSVEFAKELGIDLVDLNQLCAQSDYISVHAPLMESTRGMISDEQFDQMKKEAFIINTARGPVIDEKALIRALQEGKIAGAGLDVVENEPIPKDSPLLHMDQVILNPHVAWYSEESQIELKRKTAQNVADVLRGFYPTYLVNKEVKNKVKLKTKV